MPTGCRAQQPVQQASPGWLLPLARGGLRGILGIVPDPVLNALWCRAIAEELARGGVARAVLCPGSRNSPLLFALADVFGRHAFSHVDERSAAFIAIGAMRAGCGPVAVCVTSGSAVANCAPALAEAQAAHLPLIIIAADRPWELHGCGAPQSMPQAGVLRGLVDRELDLGEPSSEDRAVRALRARVSRLAQGAGPAVLNVPLREPLLPPPGPSTPPPGLSTLAINGRTDRPATRWVSAGSALDLGRIQRGVVIAGAHADPGIVHGWSLLGLPIIADAVSGCRHLPNVIHHADALVSGPLAADPPDLVLQSGDVPMSRAVYEWLDRATGDWLIHEGDGRDRDWLARASLRTTGLGAQVRVRADPAWLRQWSDGDRRAATTLAAAMQGEPWGEVLAAHLVCNHPALRRLVLANSMSVRHGNLHLLASPERRMVVGNRGVNGIDGQLGTLIGVASAADGPTCLLTGDLATLHDLPALAGLRLAPRGGAIVVMNNDGGAIFDYLAVAQHPGYESWVRTPQGLDFAHMVGQFGLMYHRCNARDDLARALDAALAPAGGEPARWHLVECVVRGGDTVARHRALIRAMAGA
jgi:2-succinyl-5-enolpyruvyl-6-hydroxy-3-cyclohexene-1-carboxylate synthase